MNRSRLISSLLVLLLAMGLVGLLLIVGFVVMKFSRKGDTQELERTTVSTVSFQGTVAVGSNLVTKQVVYTSVQHTANPLAVIATGDSGTNEIAAPSSNPPGSSEVGPLYHVTNPVTPVAPPPVEANRADPLPIPPGTGRTGNPGP